MIGQTIAHYRVTARLGAGGMGEVYRATDSKLGRDVALKVLPAEFAQDALRMQRFQREAQVLASLNHPNIASIYGLEHQDKIQALAMELVEGPTLAERILHGAIPFEDALPIARQIAEALEYAHEKGVIHRDLKPANIKLTSDGKVKVLDFGLAKALLGEAVPSDASNSPTISMAATKMGVILGTAAYMSPEQAKGKSVDRRADIWSFGVVLFEMLTGRQMFSGETATDIMAAVVRADPDWAALPADVPPRIRALLQRCLVKDEKRRLRDIGDARLELEDAHVAAPQAAAAAPAQNSFLRALPWAVALAAIVVAGWMYANRSGSVASSGAVMHLDIAYPTNVEPVSGLQGGIAVAPDGRAVLMIGVRGGVRRLYLRRLDRSEAIEITDTSGVNAAAFSPDGASVAFVPGSTTLTRISLADQQRSSVVTGTDLNGSVAWGASGLFYSRGGMLWTGPAQGGTPKQLTTLDAARHEVLHTDPTELPGGRFLLFSNLTAESGTGRIEVLDLSSGKRTVLVERAVSPVWSPTGHLLFGRDGAVWAVPFDAGTAAIRGDAVRVIPAGVISTVRSGSLGFQLTTNGTLLFVPFDFDSKRVMSVGRDGSELALDFPPNRYSNPRISPDGRRLLVETEASVIEALDLARGTHARLTTAAVGTSFSTWTADGANVVFRRYNVPFWAAADGSGKAGPVPSGILNDFPSSPGPDNDSIIVVRIQPESGGDIFQMSVSGKFQPKPLLVTPAYEGGPQLSPDGHWLLYQSNESGQPEIYVRRYPAMDRAWQVSEGGGVQARWSSTGREIFYRGGQRVMAVAMTSSGSEPVFGKPTALFVDEYDFGQGLSIANYDVTRDARFIMLRRGTHGSSLSVVVNWTEELKQILAAGGIR